MRRVKQKGVLAGCAIAVATFGLCTSANAAVYSGNGATGFGGPLGNGNLSITDSGGNVTFTLNNSGGFSGNDVVVYIDSVAGGFTDTSLFNDNNDGGRTAISADNSGNPSRVLISFAPGMAADYALEFENDTFDGLFALAAGGNNSLSFVTGNGPSTLGGPYVVTFPLADIGVTPGGSFSFDADLISVSGYGSNETIGTSVTVPDGTNPPNAAFNGSITFATADTYTTAVPEPASLGLIGGLSALMLVRRRKDGEPTDSVTK
jgi:hypothetical protein